MNTQETLGQHSTLDDEESSLGSWQREIQSCLFPPLDFLSQFCFSTSSLYFALSPWQTKQQQWLLSPVTWCMAEFIGVTFNLGTHGSSLPLKHAMLLLSRVVQSSPLIHLFICSLLSSGSCAEFWKCQAELEIKQCGAAATLLSDQVLSSTLLLCQRLRLSTCACLYCAVCSVVSLTEETQSTRLLLVIFFYFSINCIYLQGFKENYFCYSKDLGLQCFHFYVLRTDG